MEYLVPIISCLFSALVGFIIGYKNIKITKPTSEEILQDSIKNVQFLNTINPLVKEIYLLFVNKNTLKYFQEGHCELLISNLEIKYWNANGTTWIKFTQVPIEILKKYNFTLTELNNTLTKTDKKILNLISERVVRNNTEFIKRIFI